MTKLCKDCKYCEPVVTKFLWFIDVDYKYAKCSRDGAKDLVTGGGKEFCNIERDYSHNNKCSKDGIYWEPK